MATEVKLPDVLEGVQDVTINRWLVKAGDAVKKGQPILEVATEKVDTQIEAPVDGTILQLNAGEGEIVSVSAVLALIGSPAEKDAVKAPPPARAAEEPSEARVVEAPARPNDGQTGETAPAANIEPGEAPKSTPLARRVAEEEKIDLSQVKGTGQGGQVTKEDVLAYKAGQGEARSQAATEKAGGTAAPLAEAGSDETAEVLALPVQRLAAVYNINLRDLAQGRPLGTITREEVLQAAASRGANVTLPKERHPQWQAPALAQGQPGSRSDQGQPAQAATPSAPQAQPTPKPAQLGAGEEFVAHSRMRLLVARNTAQAAFSIPHVTTMWDVNMSAVLAHRATNKSQAAAEGVNLTVTAYLVQATLAGLRAVPAANATWTDEGVVIKKYYNIGMAVALPMDSHGMGGLIVPVIKNAGDMSLLGLARSINDLAQRARANKLTSEDLQGGTFSMSNYGTSGSRFQTPVIVSGQAGILGVGAIEKRPVVVSQGNALEPNRGDYLAFLPMLTLGFSYDHRILDGATADAFCAAVKDALENWK